MPFGLAQNVSSVLFSAAPLAVIPWGWAVGTLLLAVAVAGLAAALGVVLWKINAEARAFQRYLDAVCRLTPEEIMSPDVLDRLPALPDRGRWTSAVRQIRQTLDGHGRWAEDQRHQRTGVEIRLTRVTAELERMKRVLTGIPDPVLAIDEFGELLFANSTAEGLFGFDAGKTEDRALARLVHCEKLVQLLGSTAHRKSPAARSEELEFTDGQGQTHYYRAIASRIGESSGSGEDSGATVAVLRDIGEHKALQKRNAEFVSSVSHEMKTPLAGIKAYVELLVDGDAEDEQTREEFLGVIDGQADRLQRLVENLLNLARIEAGVVRVSKQPRSLNELLDESLRVVRPSAEAKQIELAAELSPLYLGVLADRDMLLQAVINLLSNAIKYTHPGGRVALRSRLDGEQVRFEVADTGVGLSPEDCSRVFEKFYRVSKDKNMASGTGLGLPLAKHIVEDVHGGQLTVESTLGEGTTFIVTLRAAGQLSA